MGTVVNARFIFRNDMAEHGTHADRIIDAALEIADRESWPALTLGRIAEHLQLPIADVYEVFTDLDEVANAWVKRADSAMLKAAAMGMEDGLPVDERLHLAIMGWLDALKGRRRIMGDILIYKLKPPHFHLQAHFVAATSQRIQMLRDAVGLRDTGVVKTAGEIGLTTLFAGTVGIWLTDTGDASQRTRDFLRNQLKLAGRIMSAISDDE